MVMCVCVWVGGRGLGGLKHFYSQPLVFFPFRSISNKRGVWLVFITEIIYIFVCNANSVDPYLGLHCFQCLFYETYEE